MYKLINLLQTCQLLNKNTYKYPIYNTYSLSQNQAFFVDKKKT